MTTDEFIESQHTEFWIELASLREHDERWKIVHTGGGCMAFQRDHDNSTYDLITNLDAGLPHYEDAIVVGSYDVETGDPYDVDPSEYPSLIYYVEAIADPS